jgi:hypothetical protein
MHLSAICIQRCKCVDCSGPMCVVYELGFKAVHDFAHIPDIDAAVRKAFKLRVCLAMRTVRDVCLN